MFLYEILAITISHHLEKRTGRKREKEKKKLRLPLSFPNCHSGGYKFKH